MTRIKLKGLHRIKSKGRFYYYHRATKTKLNAEFGTAEFIAEFAHIEKEYREIQEKVKTKYGTLGFLIKEYRASNYFQKLAPRTKKDYESYLLYIAPMNDLPLAMIDKPFIRKLRDKTLDEKKRAYTNYLLRVMGALFSFAVEYGYMESNPKQGIKQIPKAKSAPKANRVWTDDERTYILENAPFHLKLPLTIFAYTGLRRGDVVELLKSDITKDGWINVTTNKTGQKVLFPIHSELRKVIDQIKPNNSIYLCVNSRGQPWTGQGLRASFYKYKKREEKKGVIGEGLTFHGLRHSLVAVLRECGFTDEQIAIAVGHSSSEMTKNYGRDADNKAIMNNIISIFDAGNR